MTGRKRSQSLSGHESASPSDLEPGAASGARTELLVRELTDAESRKFLEGHHVGRIAFSSHGQPDIRPIHYVADGSWIYGRTTVNAMTDTLRHSHWVAFEVDEVMEVFEWRSVIAYGTFHVLDEDGAPDERAARVRGLELLRRVIPETATPKDPVSFRTLVFRIHIDRMTGRQASTRAD